MNAVAAGLKLVKKQLGGVRVRRAVSGKPPLELIGY